MTDAFTVTLPIPPSVNGLFATDFKTKRRFMTLAYKNWIAAATQYAPRTLVSISGDVSALYVICPSSRRKQDVENRCKALSDLMVKWEVLADDYQIVDLRVRWAKPEDGLEPGWAKATLTASS